MSIIFQLTVALGQARLSVTLETSFFILSVLSFGAAPSLLDRNSGKVSFKLCLALRVMRSVLA